MSCYQQGFVSPLGPLTVISNGAAITAIEFADLAMDERPCALTAAAVAQLQQYFAGQRQQFELPLAAQGTAFQQRVWLALQDIPYGQAASYKTIAQAIGQPQGMRAVGLANARNPLPIVVPCHRIIGSNQRLVGYAGGLDKKQWLLNHEGIEYRP